MKVAIIEPRNTGSTYYTRNIAPRRSLFGGVGRGRGGCRPSCAPVLPSLAAFFGDTKPRFFSVKEMGF